MSVQRRDDSAGARPCSATHEPPEQRRSVQQPAVDPCVYFFPNSVSGFSLNYILIIKKDV